MRIIFMGTPEFALSVLKKLYLDKNHEIICVVTQPDKPKGRGHKIIFSPVKDFALKNNLKIMQPRKLKDPEVLEEFKKMQPDFFIVAAYGKIIPEEILSLPKYFALNIHGSLLPKYRGAAPINYAIINGENVTGITLMRMDKGMDTGDIISQATCEILPEDNFGSLYNKLAEIGANELINFLDKLESGEIKNIDLKKQDDSLASYTSLIKKEFCKIDWSKNSCEIINFVRGLNPKPGAFCLYKNKILKIWGLQDFNIYGNEKPGQIVAVNKNGFAVKTFDGVLLITKIQEQGGKIMLAEDYLKGHKIELNDFLA